MPFLYKVFLFSYHEKNKHPEHLEVHQYFFLIGDLLTRLLYYHIVKGRERRFMITNNEPVICPCCKKPLLQSFRFEKNIPWSPNVHYCYNCEIRIFSWIVYSRFHALEKEILPLNSFQFEHLTLKLNEENFDYTKEDLLVLTEMKYKEYKLVYQIEGLSLIEKIYEHKTRVKN